MLRELLIARHGSSTRNEGTAPFDMPDHQVPLSNCGRMQSAALGKAIGDFIDGKGAGEKSVSIWCSPYVRAWETCGRIMRFLHRSVARIERDDRLVEWQMLGDSEFRNCESWDEMCRRVKAALVHMTEEYNLSHSPSNIVVVSHAGPIISAVDMLLRYSGIERSPEYPPLNASVRRFRIGESGRIFDMGYLFKGFLPGRLR